MLKAGALVSFRGIWRPLEDVWGDLGSFWSPQQGVLGGLGGDLGRLAASWKHLVEV